MTSKWPVRGHSKTRVRTQIEERLECSAYLYVCGWWWGAGARWLRVTGLVIPLTTEDSQTLFTSGLRE